MLFTWVPLWNCGCVFMLPPTINHTWLLYAKQVAWHISPWLRAHRTYTYTHYCWPKTPVLSSWEHVSLFTGSDLRKLTLYKGRWNIFYLIKVRFFLRKSANWAINVVGQKTEKKNVIFAGIICSSELEVAEYRFWFKCRGRDIYTEKLILNSNMNTSLSE